VRALKPRGIILSGGPMSVYEPGAPHCDPAIFDLGIPVLGICYGMQFAAHYLGGAVRPGGSREFGRAACSVYDSAGLLAGVPAETTVWMSHGDHVDSISGDFVSLAATETCPIAAVRHRTSPIYGLQFHPEVTHTVDGQRILRNFVTEICGCRGLWKLSAFIERSVDQLRGTIGADRVICGLSGGVDSAVTAPLLIRAVGPQVACIFVDNGLLRAGEAESVRATFQDHFRADLHVADAADRFLTALAGISDPQEKRK